MLKKKTRSEAAKQGWITRRLRLAAQKETPPTTSSEFVTNTESPCITKWFEDVGLSQIYSSGLEFAYANEQGEQCHPFAYCKDFLQDAVWATLNKAKASIHLFTYEYNVNPPLDLKNVRMAVRLKGSKRVTFEEKCRKSLKFMNEVEKVQGFAPTVLQFGGKHTSGNSVFVFISDAAWQHSPVMLSLYTLLLRVGMTYEEGPWREHFENAKSYLGENDKSYTTSAKKALDKIIGKSPGEVFAKKFEDNYPADCNLTGMHHNSGIVSFANENINDTVKNKWGK